VPPTTKSVLAENVGVDVPEGVVFRKTETDNPVELATAISGLPSPFKSPNFTDLGRVPTVKSVFAENEAGDEPRVIVFIKLKYYL